MVMAESVGTRDGRECRHTCLNITVDHNTEDNDLLRILCAEKQHTKVKE